MLYKSKKPKAKNSFHSSFVYQRKEMDWLSALYSIKTPFELVHAAVADIQFFSKSAVDPKCCLLTVDLFTSKTHVHPTKTRNLLARKLELFYRDIQPKREQIARNENMRLQTDLEFRQNKIKELNKKYNIEMFNSRVRRRKAYATEKILENLKNYFSEANNCIKQLLLNVSIQEN